MKKYLSLLLLPFLFGGCTLMLDEIPDPEPGTGPGYDEVATEVTEFGTVEYQFRDSVLHVSQEIFDQYLLKVETDSLLNYNDVVLYFSEALPLVPPVGGKLAAGALIEIDQKKEGSEKYSTSRALPYGLNHRVTEVQKVNGMYRIVGEKVGTEEVYKHLKYCVDADIASPDFNAIQDSFLADSLAGNLKGSLTDYFADYGYQMVVDPASGDTIVQDWNEVEVAKGIRPRGAKRKSLKRYLARRSRAKQVDDDIDEENADKDEIKSTNFLDLMVDTRNVESFYDGLAGASLFRQKLYEELKAHIDKVANANKGKKVSAHPYAAVGLKIVHYTRAHAEEDEDRGFELKYTDTWTDFIIKSELGFDAQNETGYKGKDLSDVQIPSQTSFDNIAKSIKEGGLSQGVKSMTTSTKSSWDNAKLRVVLTTSPILISFIASATFTPVVEINGCVSASLTCTTPKTRSGRKIENKVETKIDQKLEEGKITPEITLNGSIKVGAQFRAAAGIEIAGTLSLTIGANIDTFLEGKLSFDVGDAIQNGGDEDYSVFNSFNGSVTFSSYFYFDLQASVAPLGLFELWSKQLWKSDPIYLVYFSTDYSPSLFYNHGTPRFGQEFIDWMNEGGHDVGNVEDANGYISANYQIFRLNGINALMSMRSYYPAMKLYFGPIKNNKWVWMPRMNEGEGGMELMTNKWNMAKEGEPYTFYWLGNANEYAAKEDEEIREAHIVPVLVSFSNFSPTYGGALDITKANKYFGDMIEMKEHETLLEIGTPNITTVASGQIWGNSYEDTKANPHYSEGYISQTYGDVGAFCSLDNLPKMRMYQFYHTLNVYGGTRMGNWGVKVYVFDTNGKTRLYRRKLPINQLRSGRYTFIFSFMTDWQQKSSSEHLYYRVQPYWGDPQQASGDEAFAATDAASLKKYPLDYECVDDQNIEQQIRSGKGTTWGTIKDVNLNDNK